MEVKRKEGESPTSLLYRFSKKVQQSGILKEVRKRRFKGRLANRTKRRRLALKREVKRAEISRKRRLGLL
jgi:ribosomal protein S21